MLDNLSTAGAAALVSLGLVVAGTGAPTAPKPITADLQLTTSVLAIGGLGYETIEPDLIKRVLGGYFANEENLVGLPWPGQMAPWNGTLTLNESVAVGIDNMEAAIRNTPGPKIAAGASGSTLVVDEVMLRLANDPTAPPADELSFVVMGDANRGVFKRFPGVKLPVFDYTVPEIPVTKYDVMVIAGEYDGIADWPDRAWNLLAVINALAATGLLQQIIPEDIVKTLALDAFGSVHYDAMFADITKVPAENITTTVNAAGGVTTTYLVPTADLPMLRPLKALGVPQAGIDLLEAVLRPIVDSAYIRNDPWRKPLPWRQPAQARPAPAGTAVLAAPPAPVSAVSRVAVPATPVPVARPVAATSASPNPGAVVRDVGTAQRASGKAGKRHSSAARSAD